MYALETGFFVELFVDNRFTDMKRGLGIWKTGGSNFFGVFVGKQGQTGFCNAV